MDEDRVGQIIAGTYRVEKALGRGAFGHVWLTRRIANSEPVVLKVLHPQWARVPAVIERFRREGEIAYRIQHPNVAQVFDYSTTDDGVPYLALEYLDGHTLKEELVRHRQLSPARTAELWAPVCDAVAAAHAAGVVHRDLKPENVMLVVRDGKLTPIVLDFGIAKFLDAAEKITSTGSMLGTPTYMAPEQCRGQTDLGPPADVYALGAICFELCSGRPPFSGKTVAELAMKHLMDPAPPLAGVPAPLAQMVARCMEKEPAARPQAADLARVLRQVATMPGASQVASLAVATAPTLAGGQQVPTSAMAQTVLSADGGKKVDEEAARRTADAKRPKKGGASPALVIGAVVLLAIGIAAVVSVVLLK